ncbi:MAG: DUF4139 domain-containing protein [Candidatus Schekmanbacteria bacterium]|nr:DUF4139 domain-containing protein [Candidatus Schekmanbacteria bacterium]
MIFLFQLSSIAAAEKEDGKNWLITCEDETQTGIALTVYNNNLGLVKDQRSMSIPKGIGEIRFMDVAADIIPASVSIKSIVKPDSLNILEQNYEYDLLSPGKLLDKFVGKEIKLYQKNPYTEREEVVTATLLANNEKPVFQIGNEITFNHPGRIIFPSVPENLISKPTLVWLAENNLRDEQKVEVSYLTEGINWQSDYVLILNEKDDAADLSGWVTIDNKSGTTYKNAKLKLVAGDVNKVERKVRRKGAVFMAADIAEAAPQFKEEGFFEYHIYTLQRPATVKDNQTKQINLITAEGIKVKKEFRFSSNNYNYFDSDPGFGGEQKVKVFIEIANRKENNLGIPLPKGIIRTYKGDTEGSLQFIGEDSINHTPENEKITIKIGEAFDVVGERKQTDWRKLANDTYESAYEITLRNHKKEDITVKVTEPIPGDWTIILSSHEYKKPDASTAEFNINVPNDGEAKLIYRVRVRQ